MNSSPNWQWYGHFYLRAAEIIHGTQLSLNWLPAMSPYITSRGEERDPQELKEDWVVVRRLLGSGLHSVADPLLKFV